MGAEYLIWGVSTTGPGLYLTGPEQAGMREPVPDPVKRGDQAVTDRHNRSSNCVDQAGPEPATDGLLIRPLDLLSQYEQAASR